MIDMNLYKPSAILNEIHTRRSKTLFANKKSVNCGLVLSCLAFQVNDDWTIRYETSRVAFKCGLPEHEVEETMENLCESKVIERMSDTFRFHKAFIDDCVRHYWEDYDKLVSHDNIPREYLVRNHAKRGGHE